MQLDEIVGPERAARLRRIFLGALNDAYTENCGRYSEDLGDNNLTFAVAVIHNLRHMLEEALEYETGVKVTRPHNSFQVEIDSSLAVHFYKGRSGVGGVGEIRFNESRTKLNLVTENAAQLALVFEEDTAPFAGREARHLVVVHVGKPTDGLTDAWIGAPALSPVNGFQWLWGEGLDGTEVATVPASDVAAATPAWLGNSSLPELIVELREPGDQAGEANIAP